MSCPLKNFSWVVPGILAGSAAPASPDDVAWIAKNFNTVVCLKEEPDPHTPLINSSNVRTIHFPIVDRTVPTDAQFDKMAHIVCGSDGDGAPAASASSSSSGEYAVPASWPILVFCKAGIGRTAYFLLAGFIALFLRQGELRLGLGMDLKRILFGAPSSSESSKNDFQQLTGALLIAHLKNHREVNISESVVDDLITRWKLNMWSTQCCNLASTCSIHGSSSGGGGGRSNSSFTPQKTLENFRVVVRSVVSACSFPSPALTGAELVQALQQSQGGFRSILNLDTKTYTQDQYDALAAAGIRAIHVPIVSGGAPSMVQMHRIAEIFLDRASNWPLLLHCGGGRGRSGCATACGIAALRFANDPVVAAVGRSSNDVILFVRSHLGPIAVENIDQEKVLTRFIASLHLTNLNTVISGVLSYSVCPPTQTLLNFPQSTWLAVHSTGAFSSVVLFGDRCEFLVDGGDDAMTKQNQTTLLPSSMRRLRDFLRTKGVAFHFLHCREGHSLGKQDLKTFTDEIVCNPRKWPMLCWSSNGHGRCITMATIALVHLTRRTINGDNNSNTLAQKFLRGRVSDSVATKTADELLAFRERVHLENSSCMSVVTAAQRKAVRDAVESCSTLREGVDVDNNEDEDEDVQLVKFIAFGDFGAPLDSDRLQQGLRTFAGQLAKEIRTNGKPDCFLALGDLFYWNGVQLPKNDPMFANWRKVFLETYPDEFVGIPWKPILGNHDRRGSSFYNNPDTAQYVLDYTKLGEDENPGGVWQFRGNDPNEKPSDSYSFVLPYRPDNQQKKQNLEHDDGDGDHHKVFFAGFDTNVAQTRCRNDVPELVTGWARRLAWLEQQLSSREAQSCLWKVMFAHHPWGGNTGTGHFPEGQMLREGLMAEDGKTLLQPLDPIVNEKGVDLAVCGHEHELWCKVRGPNAMIHVVSGATMEWARYGRTLPSFFELHRGDWESDVGTIGFTRVTITKNDKAQFTRMLVEFVNGSDLKVLHRVSKVKHLPSTAAAADDVKKKMEKTTSHHGSDDDDDSLSSLARSESQMLSHYNAAASKPAIIIVNYPTMLEALSPMVDILRRVADVHTFTSTRAAMEAVQLLLRRGVPLAALVTNMRRRREFSGIHCINKFVTHCQQNALRYNVPIIMFSHHGARNPQISFDAGASILFHTSVEKLQSQLLAAVETGRWARLCAEKQISAAVDFFSSSSSSSKAVAASCSSTTTTTTSNATDELAASHCFEPLPPEAGGLVKTVSAQQLIFTQMCAAYEKLQKSISKAIIEEASVLGIDDNEYCIRGESALSYWSSVAFTEDNTRGRTPTMDLAVLCPKSGASAVEPLARRVQTCVQSQVDVVRTYLAHASLRGEIQSNDFVRIRNENVAPSAAAAGAGVPFSVVVEVPVFPVGGMPLFTTSNESDDAQVMMRWTVARIAFVPCFSSSSAAGTSTATSTEAPSQQQPFQVSSSMVVETTAGTRLCPGVLVLSPEATLRDLEAASKSAGFYAHRARLLSRFMKEDVLPRVK